MKFDFNKKFLTAGGKEDAGLTMAEFLSPALAHAKGIASTYQQKFWNWSVALASSGTLDLDDADAKFLANFIRSHNDLPVVVQQQSAEILEAKEAA